MTSNDDIFNIYWWHSLWMSTAHSLNSFHMIVLERFTCQITSVIFQEQSKSPNSNVVHDKPNCLQYILYSMMKVLIFICLWYPKFRYVLRIHNLGGMRRHGYRTTPPLMISTRSRFCSNTVCTVSVIFWISSLNQKTSAFMCLDVYFFNSWWTHPWASLHHLCHQALRSPHSLFISDLHEAPRGALYPGPFPCCRLVRLAPHKILWPRPFLLENASSTWTLGSSINNSSWVSFFSHFTWDTSK